MAALTARFDKALFYSSVLSRALSRETNDLDLTARALATAALVIGAGGNEDEAISSLLLEIADGRHDQRMLVDIGALFGSEVLAILEDCLASNYRKVAATWRSGVYSRIVSRPPRSTLVALADSMVMAGALHASLIGRGSQAWNGYEASREDVLRHFELLVRAFVEIQPGALAAQFESLVSELLCAASPYNAEPLPFRPRITRDDESGES